MMKLILPLPEGTWLWQENKSSPAFYYGPREYVKKDKFVFNRYMTSRKITISCLPGNKKFYYYCLFMNENEFDRKTKVDHHIFMVSWDMSIRKYKFPVGQETGNGIIYSNSGKNMALTKKTWVDEHICIIPGDMSKWIMKKIKVAQEGILSWFIFLGWMDWAGGPPMIFDL